MAGVMVMPKHAAGDMEIINLQKHRAFITPPVRTCHQDPV